jgi:hypothetical protein
MDPKEPLSIVGPSEDFTATVAMENTNAQANARLIAAAPELLEALIKAYGFIDLAIGVPRTEIQAQIRAAIDKVTQ